MVRSHSLIFSDFNTDWYSNWAKQLKQNSHNLEGHALKANKFWQNAILAQVFYERNLLKSGNSCIGFGVGRERLPALFAKYDMQVMATDQDFRTKKAKHWDKHELAHGTESLNKLGICPIKKFTDNVSYSAVDMKKIPKKFNEQYDFVWSNCALGHLGSIEAGLDFIVDSATCLKPGGYAAHTTEVNVISNSLTLDNNPETVIFRPKDIYKLAFMLRRKGFELSPLNLTFGSTKKDQQIAMSPRFGNDYSKLQVGGHILTQVVLIVHKPLRSKQSALYNAKHMVANSRNVTKQKRFKNKNTLLKQIDAFNRTSLNNESIKPLKKTYKLTLKAKPGTLYLEYKNTTDYPIFGMHDRLISTKPIALATSGPTDRSSKFKANDWFSNDANRPSISLCLKNKEGAWVQADYIRPNALFAYKLTLDPKKVKPGSYIEEFMIVHEGSSFLKDSSISVEIEVTSKS